MLESHPVTTSEKLNVCSQLAVKREGGGGGGGWGGPRKLHACLKFNVQIIFAMHCQTQSTRRFDLPWVNPAGFFVSLSDFWNTICLVFLSFTEWPLL